MKVLVADALHQDGIDDLEAAGHEVVVGPKLKDDALLAALQESASQILIVRSTKVTAPMIDCPALCLIIRAGAGYDNVDHEHASNLGVFVSNCPGKNSSAVAELVIGLMVAIDRRIPENVTDARNGMWNKKTYSKADGLSGRTLGVIGCGNIGQGVLQRAYGFNMRCCAWSRSLTPEAAEEYGAEYFDDMLAMVAECDVVSVNVAANGETAGLCGREFFEAMKDGAIFINTTRSTVVDEDALVWAMEEKGIRAGLDVFDGEPSIKEGEFESSLAAHPSVYITHHIGASTDEALSTTAKEAARVANVYADTGDAVNCVNLETHSPATHLMLVRHEDRVGVLAAVLECMRTAHLNIEEMQNTIFRGARAAVAQIRFSADADAPVAEVAATIAGLDAVISASTRELL